MKKKIWFDILNVPQVHFLLGISSLLENDIYKKVYSVRKFSETENLLEQQIGNNFVSFGAHQGKNKVKKAIGTLDRFIHLYKQNIDFDISISCGSENAIWTSALKRRKSIAFGDNDTAQQWTYGHFVDYAFFPNAISRNVLEKQGLKNKLYLYDGYKEDIYLANYIPRKYFLNSLPFDNYVIVRPENLNARYIRNGNVASITPILLKLLTDRGYNILYLPRYETDKIYAKEIKNIYIPKEPINGLDASYFADCVLTGAGTFAREAACLGVPAVSFFAGKQLLAVDQKMIRDKKIFFSRDPHEIVEKLKKLKKHEPDLTRSKRVQEEVISKLKEVINNLL